MSGEIQHYFLYSCELPFNIVLFKLRFVMKQPELGKRISQLRKEKGFTQEELVERCNINVRTLQRIENGDVTPRSYTIKTILSALDQDLENLQVSNGQHSNSVLGPISKQESKSVHTLLTWAWVSGILYLIMAIFEGMADYLRVEDGELIFGLWGHVGIKCFVLVFNLLFFYGYLVAGKILGNYLMKIVVVIYMVTLIVFYGYDIFSLFNEVLEIEVVFMAEGLVFGILGMLFGTSILKSSKKLGPIAFAAGVSEFIMSFCLMTLVLSILGLVLFFPTAILEMVLLFKIALLVKEKME